jgi:cytidylate kinase
MEKDRRLDMTVITISRELGSEGDKIADLLCQELGYCRVDKDMLSQIAKEAGVDVEAVLAKEKAILSKPRLISGDLTGLYTKDPNAFEKKSALDDRTYTRIVRETMEEFARQGNGVIVGRGGQMVLRDWRGALHVRLYAPAEVRIQRIMQRFNISEAQARRRITRSDEQKRQYIRTMHNNASWKDLKYYHLAINTGDISPEVAAQIIMLAAGGREEAL